MNKIRRGYKIKFPDGHLETIISVAWIYLNKNRKKLCISTEETFNVSINDKKIIKNFK